MTEKLHQNYRWASNLIFITLALNVIELWLTASAFLTTEELLYGGLWLMFVVCTAYVIRRGVNWMKYVLLILTLLAMLGLGSCFNNPALSRTTLWITSLESIVWIAATVLLFKIPATTDHDALDSDI